MIFELETATVQPGRIGDAISTMSRASEIRSSRYGRLVGAWSTDTGPLNQLIELRSYEDPEERDRLAAELAAAAEWEREVLSPAADFVVARDRKPLAGVGRTNAAPRVGNVYELRTYRVAPGVTAVAWAELLLRTLPVREKYSPAIGIWVGEGSEESVVRHLWVYPDFNTRSVVRAAVMRDPGWQAFLAKSGPMLASMQSSLLIPTPYSPLA